MNVRQRAAGPAPYSQARLLTIRFYMLWAGRRERGREGGLLLWPRAGQGDERGAHSRWRRTRTPTAKKRIAWSGDRASGPLGRGLIAVGRRSALGLRDPVCICALPWRKDIPGEPASGRRRAWAEVSGHGGTQAAAIRRVPGSAPAAPLMCLRYDHSSIRLRSYRGKSTIFILCSCRCSQVVYFAAELSCTISAPTTWRGQDRSGRPLGAPSAQLATTALTETRSTSHRTFSAWACPLRPGCCPVLRHRSLTVRAEGNTQVAPVVQELARHDFGRGGQQAAA